MRGPTFIFRSVKRAWHADLVAHPATHAFVLNLYRAGEHHPSTVLDYFPVPHAPSDDLRAKLTRHRDDELRHTRMYGRALALLGQPEEEQAGLDVFNNAIRACTAASFVITDELSAPERTRRVAHFLAHAHFLERRIEASLGYHLEACHAAGVPASVVAIVEAVHHDEARHTAYTEDAVRTLLGVREGAQVLAHHREAEARADRLFSARQVRRFLARFPHAGRRSHRALYAAGALLMEGGLPHG